MFIKYNVNKILDDLYLAIQKSDTDTIYKIVKRFINSHSNIRYIIKAFTKRTPDYVLVEDRIEEAVQEIVLKIIKEIDKLQKQTKTELKLWLEQTILSALSKVSYKSYQSLTKSKSFTDIQKLALQKDRYADPEYFIDISELLKELFRLYRKHFTKQDIEDILHYHRELSMNINESLANYYLRFVSFLIFHKDTIQEYLKQQHRIFRYRTFYRLMKSILKGHNPYKKTTEPVPLIRHFQNMFKLIEEKNKKEEIK